jgi:hypothetical protein
MPRVETVLRVFAASPGDLVEERNTLGDVVNELNVTWSKTLGLRLELVRWETHTYPSIGNDAQAAINEQIADDYDIFVGLMWSRFGTPTERAGSGTAEEFYRAYKKHQENPNQVRVMFYFKDSPIAPSELDPEQLALIKKFQQDLGGKGTYYWTYDSRDEFAQLIRMHLGRQVQEWEKSWGITLTGDSEINATETISLVEEELKQEHDENNEEEGFLDLLEIGQENFEVMNEALTRMASAMHDLGKRANAGTDELNQAKSSSGIVEIKQAKRISNRVAEGLNNFAALMEVDVPVFASSFSSGIESYTRALTLSEDFATQDSESVKEAHSQIQQLEATILDTKIQMVSFRDSIAGLPRATTIFNKARKRALSILDELDREFTTAVNLTSEMEKLLDQFNRGQIIKAATTSVFKRRKDAYEELAKGAE